MSGASLCVHVRDCAALSISCAAAATARQVPWNADTLVNIWSATKGVVAIAVAMLVDEGRLSYPGDPVAMHWPEFAQGGKRDITVAQVMSHQSGVNGFGDPTDGRRSVRLGGGDVTSRGAGAVLAAGHQTSYHAVTYGFLAGELVRRASGSVGSFLADGSAAFASRIFIGVPERATAHPPVRGPNRGGPFRRACSHGAARDLPSFAAELPTTRQDRRTGAGGQWSRDRVGTRKDLWCGWGGGHCGRCG